MRSILTGFGMLEHRKEEETSREEDEDSGHSKEETKKEDDEDSSRTSDSTNTPNPTPSSTDSSSGDNPFPLDSVLSLPPPVLLAPIRGTVIRRAHRGPVYRQRHQATTDKSREESHQPVPDRRLGQCSEVAVPQPAFSLPHGNDAEDIAPERGSVLGDNWLRARVERPSTPSLPIPLTGRNCVVDSFVSDSSDSPAHHRSSEPQSPAFSELSNSTITLGRDGFTTTTTTTNTKNESPSPIPSPPRKPATEPAKPRYTHGLAMARAAGHLSIAGLHRTPQLPRGPPRSDNRDARADPMAVVPASRQEYPERDRLVEPWRDDQREARAYVRHEIGPALGRDKLWFHQDIRKGYVDRTIKQSDCDKNLMEERMKDSIGTDKETLVWRPVPRSGSFGPGWVFLDPIHGWIRC
ncbi:hypothetical protein FHL15_000459 [Xylaria flabelliformis]|uniref:Uncharacterized protein n=1 Tax=Xylaria flabelliformis TaxID=2512241 RepID=A0A553IDV3_9PEZI|nr:hypothetical protein FHL15_000459 [Xylaria flabelliformis]